LYKLTGPIQLVQKHGPNAFGEIYLQIKYLPLGAEDSGPEPELIEDLEAILKKENELIKGDLKFSVLHAKGLVKEDQKNKNIEALCKVTIPTVKEATSSKAKSDMPVWNFTKDFRISIPRSVSLVFFSLITFCKSEPRKHKSGSF